MNFLKNISLSIIFIFVLSGAFAQSSVDNIISDYYGLKNALAAGSSANAQTSAKTLLADLSSPGKLSSGQEKLFNSYAEKLKFDARHISESNDIEHQREHFASLSKNWYEVLKGLKINKANVYVDYCPMKKAYWLSESPAIKNPYYSDKVMATCGKVAVTLNGVK